MKEFELEAMRAVEVLRALDVQVGTGQITWASKGDGSPRPHLLPRAAWSPTVGPLPPDSGQGEQWHVIQGSNIFTFGPDEEKEARAFAKALSEGLEKLQKAQKKTVAKRFHDILGS